MMLSALLIPVFYLIGAYLFGSVSSAIIICKLSGLPDPRSQGSGNPGATNVLRFGGKKLAVMVLLGDTLKGFVPVLLAKYTGQSDYLCALVGFAAFIGHLYPIFFRFQGGKGVATCLGVLLALNWLVGLTVISTWLVVAVIFRYSSLAALVTFTATPVYSWLIIQSASIYYHLILAFMCFILIVRHIANIKRLINGEESRIGEKKIVSSETK